MALFTFKLPDIGEGIAEAEIVAWHVTVGQRIEEDAPIADMLTDKATVEIETPVAGVITQIAGKVGDAVPIGGMLVVIETDGEAPVEEAPVVKAAPAPAPVAAVPTPPPPPVAPEPAPAKPEPTAQVLASPAVRARAKALGVDLAQIRAEGRHIRHADLDAFLRYGSAQGYRAPNPVGGGGAAPRPDEVIPVIGMRRRIAQNMAAAKRHIPHFTYVEEIEVTALEACRAQLNQHRGERPKLTVLPFLITAMCRALADFPMLNARYDDEGTDGGGSVTRFGAVQLGVAAQTPQGLMVPVLRNADSLNIWQIAAEVSRLAAAARDGSASREELSGSTITLTSLGTLGGVVSTPVINRPEVAILGVGRIIERPVFVDGTSDRIRRAALMNLSISCDHRVVDGHDAASFVGQMKRLIEAPALLLTP